MKNQKGFDREVYPELKEYWEKFESTVKPYIEIKNQINEKMSYWQSKFDGYPYWPKTIKKYTYKSINGIS
jgi:uncharacterized protein YwqG